MVRPRRRTRRVGTRPAGQRTDRYGGYRIADGAGTQTTRPYPDPIPGIVTPALIARHCAPRGPTDLIGLHALGIDSTGKRAAVDIDAHPGQTADPAANERYAVRVYDRLVSLGLSPLLTSPNGAAGYHVRALFTEPVPGPMPFPFGKWMVRDHADHELPAASETFPKQSTLTDSTKYGNWLRVPGRHPKRDRWSEVCNGREWLTGERAVSHVLSLTGDDPFLIPAEAYPSLAPEPRHTPPTGTAEVADGNTPWDAFNRAADWPALLTASGAKPAGARGDVAAWTRPGKDSGVSVTLGFACDERGVKLLFPFTSNWPNLPATRFYSPLQFVYAQRHGGNVSPATLRETVRHLIRIGAVSVPDRPRRPAKA